MRKYKKDQSIAFDAIKKELNNIVDKAKSWLNDLNIKESKEEKNLEEVKTLTEELKTCEKQIKENEDKHQELQKTITKLKNIYEKDQTKNSENQNQMEQDLGMIGKLILGIQAWERVINEKHGSIKHISKQYQELRFEYSELRSVAQQSKHYSNDLRKDFNTLLLESGEIIKNLGDSHLNFTKRAESTLKSLQQKHNKIIEEKSKF